MNQVERERRKDPIGWEQTRLHMECQIALKLALEDAGITQAKLAEMAGTIQPNVSRALNGRGGASLRHLAKLAYHLGMRFEVKLVPLDAR